MTLSAEDQKTCDDAHAFARANRKAIALRCSDVDLFLPEEQPVAAFFALCRAHSRVRQRPTHESSM